MTRTLARAALFGAVASIPASMLKAISERQPQRAAESLWPPSEPEKQLVGADPTSHLENMPPAVLADRVARRLGYGPLDTTTKLRIQNAIHYTFGALSGSAYRVLAEAFPAASAGAGTAAGWQVSLSDSHCGAGWVLGDICGEWIDAIKSDTLSVLSFEVGLFGLDAGARSAAWPTNAPPPSPTAIARSRRARPNTRAREHQR
jgi:hypothetical protein